MRASRAAQSECGSSNVALMSFVAAAVGRRVLPGGPTRCTITGMIGPNVKTKLPPDGARGRIPGLSGISGRLSLHVDGDACGAIEVEDGEVIFRLGAGESDAVAICDSVETMVAIGQGQLNPVVAALQNRLELEGDRAFAIKVIRELHGTSPFAARKTKEG